MEKYDLGKSFKNLEKTLITEICKSNKVFITAHNNMDFDALASASALAEICKNYEVTSYIVTNDNENEMKNNFHSLFKEVKNKYNVINSDQLNTLQDENDLIIFTDVNSVRRSPLDNISNFKRIIVIDHHSPDKDKINTNNIFINPKTSSASEILFTVLKKLDIYIEQDLAQKLLAGIYQDTLGLTLIEYPSTLLAITKLFDYGANYQEVRELFTITFKERLIINELHAHSKFYNFYNDTNNYIIAITYNSEIPEYLYTEIQLANAVDELLKYPLDETTPIDAAFILGYTDNSTLSIKARSRLKETKEVNVNKIIKQLTNDNGGGCINRAATTIHTSD